MTKHTQQHSTPTRRWYSRVLAIAREESGQAAAELALVACVLLLLVLGIAELGLALNTANDETTLASSAARYAAVNFNPSNSGTLAAWVQSQADTGLLSNNATVNICFPNGTSNVGDPVKVTVSVNFGWQPLSGISALTGGAVPSSTTITGSAVMRLEAIPTVYAGGACA
jgi:Flp pilus assembly protein TadG